MEILIVRSRADSGARYLLQGYQDIMSKTKQKQRTEIKEYPKKCEYCDVVDDGTENSEHTVIGKVDLDLCENCIARFE